MAYQCRNDQHWTMEFVSTGARELTGYAPEALIHNAGAAFAELIHADDRAAVRAAVDGGLAADGHFEIEYRIRTADGATKWVRERGHAVYDTDGELIGLEGFILDIHAEKRSEAKLRERERLLTTLVDHLPDGAVHIFDRDLRYVFSAGQALDALGLSDQDLAGRTVVDVLGPESGGRVARQLRRALAGETVRFEGETGGTTFRVTAAPLRDDRGAVTAVVALSMDVTEAKARERQLQEVNRTLRVLSHSNQAVLHSESEEQILEEVCRIAVEEGGYRMAWVSFADDAVVRSPGPWRSAVEGLRPPDIDPDALPVPEAIRTRRHVVLRDLEAAPGAGPWRDEALARGVRSCAVFPLLEGDRCLGALVVCSGGTDVFDEAELGVLGELAGDLAYGMAVHRARVRERQLEERLRRAEKLEAIGHLAGGVAHDFNNSLTVITGLTEMLLEGGELSESVRRDVEEVKRAAERSANLTRQLLAFSHQQAVHPRLVDLSDAVREKRAFLERLLGEQYTIELSLEPVDPIRIDPTQVEQIVMNLAVNARDAMPDGGTLIVETANVDVTEELAAGALAGRLDPGPCAMLAVTDTGTGMSPETLDHIFDPFFTTKPRGKGTGLGLATVYGIVEQNRGGIHVASEPGRGSRFAVYFPRQRARRPEPPGRQPTGLLRGTETILVVEDEKPVRTVVQRILEGQGYRVRTAGSAAEALRVTGTEDPIHLLLTDIVLPDLSGRELARRLVEARPGLAVILTSGYDPDEVGTDAAHEVFIPKPFDREKLIRGVRTVLDRTTRRP
ncbi:MAG: PAS domain-containing protein [Gemmatimonadota bacterium]